MAKILVADDELSMRQFLEILLKKEGHEVVCAADGEEALSRFQAAALRSADFGHQDGQDGRPGVAAESQRTQPEYVGGHDLRPTLLRKMRLSP